MKYSPYVRINISKGEKLKAKLNNVALFYNSFVVAFHLKQYQQQYFFFSFVILTDIEVSSLIFLSSRKLGSTADRNDIYDINGLAKNRSKKNKQKKNLKQKFQDELAHLKNWSNLNFFEI